MTPTESESNETEMLKIYIYDDIILLTETDIPGASLDGSRDILVVLFSSFPCN